MKNTTYIIVLLLISFAGDAAAQTLKAYEREARKAMQEKDYATALNYYTEAVDIDSTKIGNRYQLAEAARQFNALRIAEENYQIVTDKRAFDKYRLTDYHLASVQKGRGEYEEAISNFRKFINDYDQNAYVDDEIVEDAKAQIQECLRAKEIVDNALTYVEIENLRGLNTPDSEFAGVQTSYWFYYGALFFEKDKDSYSASKAVLESFRSPDFDTTLTVPFFDRRDIHTAYSPDDTKLFFTTCEFRNAGDYRCDLYLAQKDAAGNWGDSQALPFNQPTVSNTQPNVGVLANGEQWLFFASDRDSTQNMDLYYCTIAADGTIGKPVELDVLNTNKDEVTPFFHSPSQTLFFSTEGRPSLGKLDIYETQLIDGQWTEPVALGYPINSSYNDTYYWRSEAGDTAYLSSNRAGSVYELDAYETCCSDLYRAVYDIDVELTVNTTCATAVEMPDVRYRLFDAENNTLLEGNMTDSEFTLKTGRMYELIAEKTGFTQQSIIINTKGILKPTTLSEQFDLYPEDNATISIADEIRKEPLPGAEVQLYEGDDMIYKVQLDANESSFKYTLKPETAYQVIAQKEGYLPDTLRFYTDDLEEFCDGIEKELALNEEIPTYLPITLYFFNDQPEPRTYATTTDSSYTEIFDVYFDKIPIFKREHRKGVQFTTDIQRDSAALAVESFFRDSVQMGYERLGLFAESVLSFLERGRRIEVPIQGFASPLASSQYNENLSRRRIASIQNFFREYQNGVFISYVQSGALQFKGNPQGENDERTRQQQAALENLDDKANTVYSPLASEGRRIQITELNFLDSNNSTSQRQ